MALGFQFGEGRPSDGATLVSGERANGRRRRLTGRGFAVAALVARVAVSGESTGSTAMFSLLPDSSFSSSSSSSSKSVWSWSLEEDDAERSLKESLLAIIEERPLPKFEVPGDRKDDFPAA